METKSQEKTNFIDGMSSVLEQNVLGVKVGIYSVALAGLLVAIRSVRPFSKFVRPSQIPKDFYKKHVKLNGKVLGISPSENNPLLILDHSPLLFSKLRRERGLPVSLEGVDISGNGFSWLQTVLKNTNVEFVLIKPSEKSARCIVFHDKTNVANRLVSLGFARVSTYDLSLDDDQIYSKYYKDLLKEERKADRRNEGIWSGSAKAINLMLAYFLTMTRNLKSKRLATRKQLNI